MSTMPAGVRACLLAVAHHPHGTNVRTGIFAQDGVLRDHGYLNVDGTLTDLAHRHIKGLTMTDTDTLANQLTPLAAEYAALAEQADAIKNRQEEIKATIRDLVPGADKYAAGALTVTVSTNRRFDEKRALAMLPEAIAPLVTFPETRVDKDRLKVLAPDVFEASQETFSERVTIR